MSCFVLPCYLSCACDRGKSYLATCVTGKSLWDLFLEQFDELLVKILLLAAVISFVSILCGTSVMVAEGVGRRGSTY